MEIHVNHAPGLIALDEIIRKPVAGITDHGSSHPDVHCPIPERSKEVIKDKGLYLSPVGSVARAAAESLRIVYVDVEARKHDVSFVGDVVFRRRHTTASPYNGHKEARYAESAQRAHPCGSTITRWAPGCGGAPVAPGCVPDEKRCAT